MTLKNLLDIYHARLLDVDIAHRGLLVEGVDFLQLLVGQCLLHLDRVRDSFQSLPQSRYLPYSSGWRQRFQILPVTFSNVIWSLPRLRSEIGMLSVERWRPSYIQLLLLEGLLDFLWLKPTNTSLVSYNEKVDDSMVSVWSRYLNSLLHGMKASLCCLL